MSLEYSKASKDAKTDCSKVPDFAALNEHLVVAFDNSEPDKKVPPGDANCVSSKLWTDDDGVTHHIPVLDIDLKAALVPSTTPGHYHLYIDKILSDEKYGKLLEVMVECGIVQQGILDNQWKKNGYTAVRIPSVKKMPDSKSSGETGTLNKMWESLLDVAEVEGKVALPPVSIAHNPVPAAKEMAVVEGLAKVSSSTGLPLKDIYKIWKKVREDMYLQNVPKNMPGSSPF